MLTWFGGHEAGHDMARANARPIDAAKVDAHLRQLKAAVKDGDAWKAAYGALIDDASLSAQEVVAVAQAFVGTKYKTRKAALTGIGQERMRVSHAKSKGESAAKTRLW